METEVNSEKKAIIPLLDFSSQMYGEVFNHYRKIKKIIDHCWEACNKPENPEDFLITFQPFRDSLNQARQILAMAFQALSTIKSNTTLPHLHDSDFHFSMYEALEDEEARLNTLEIAYRENESIVAIEKLQKASFLRVQPLNPIARC